MGTRLIRLLIAASGLTVACSSGSANSGSSFNKGGGTASISQLCAQMSSLPCSDSTQAECEADGNEAYADAQQAGCVDQLNAVVSCYTSNPPTCGPDGAQVSAACTDELKAYIACDPMAICVSTHTDSSCSYKCGDTSLSCESANGGSTSCTCSSGTRQGMQFTPTSGDGCSRDELRAHCE